MNDNNPSAEEINVIAFDDKGKVDIPKERLKSASKLRSIHSKFCEDDRASERNRAKVQDLKDYKPPLKKALLAKAGQRGRFNINFGEMATIVNEASAGYIDNFESPEHLVPIKLERGYLEDLEKTQYERVMSDEFTKLIRGWDSSYFEYLMMVDQFVTHGVAIGYYTDKYTWQWSGAGLREFKFPRKTKASSDGIEICTCEGQLGHAKLADMIADEEVAKSAGWDVRAVRHALASSQGDLYDEENAEDMQEMAKANDLDDISGKFNPINVIYSWVKEYDGTVSYYIACKDTVEYPEAEGDNDLFLYKKLKAYDNFGQAMQLFPFYTGKQRKHLYNQGVRVYVLSSRVGF